MIEKILSAELKKAVDNKYPVVFRIEDKTSDDTKRDTYSDAEVKTVLTNVHINEKDKYANIEGENFNLQFKFSKCSEGTESSKHKKYYIEGENSIVTITIHF